MSIVRLKTRIYIERSFLPRSRHAVGVLSGFSNVIFGPHDSVPDIGHCFPARDDNVIATGETGALSGLSTRVCTFRRHTVEPVRSSDASALTMTRRIQWGTSGTLPKSVPRVPVQAPGYQVRPLNADVVRFNQANSL